MPSLCASQHAAQQHNSAQHTLSEGLRPVCLLSCRGEAEDLQLKCQASTQLHVLFGEPWLVQITHARLAGAVPHDRCADWAAAPCIPARKPVMHGHKTVSASTRGSRA